jgi:hypothetical protein
VALTSRLDCANPRLTRAPLLFPCRRFSKSFFAEFNDFDENPDEELD